MAFNSMKLDGYLFHPELRELRQMAKCIVFAAFAVQLNNSRPISFNKLSQLDDRNIEHL
jgi:hypothetical protein